MAVLTTVTTKVPRKISTDLRSRYSRSAGGDAHSTSVPCSASTFEKSTASMAYADWWGWLTPGAMRMASSRAIPNS